ncbi:unnamed protein product, partial [marine sediment metagenome]
LRVFEAQVLPAIPVIAKDLTKPVVGCGLVGVTPGGR